MIWHKNLLLLIILHFGLSACVSVSLPRSKPTKAQGVRWQSPSAPFQSLRDEVSDESWISSKTGNTISFLSECNAQSDRSLEALQNESLTVLSKMKVIQEKAMEYNGRRALWTEAQGEVDGIPVRISLVTLKKNDCDYSLTYSGLEKSFDKEKSHFEKFVEKFEAP